MASITITRLCAVAVARSASTASETTAQAVSKPNVISVPARSLSIVFGTPMTGISRAKGLSPAKVPSPPATIRPSIASLRYFSRNSASRPAVPQRFEVPRRVPASEWMLRMFSRRMERVRPSKIPSKPSSMPRSSTPAFSKVRQHDSRIPFSPGASPPPVSSPIFMVKRVTEERRDLV